MTPRKRSPEEIRAIYAKKHLKGSKKRDSPQNPLEEANKYLRDVRNNKPGYKKPAYPQYNHKDFQVPMPSRIEIYMGCVLCPSSAAPIMTLYGLSKSIKKLNQLLEQALIANEGIDWKSITKSVIQKAFNRLIHESSKEEVNSFSKRFAESIADSFLNDENDKAAIKNIMAKIVSDLITQGIDWLVGEMESFIEASIVISARKAEGMQQLSKRGNLKGVERLDSMDNHLFLTDEEKRTKRLNPKLRFKDLNIKFSE
jgi:hypothetical protein